MAEAGGLATASPAGAYLAALRARFERAAAAAGASEHLLELGGLRLALRFAGAPMRDALLPPFAHLEVGGDPATAELSVAAFDSAATGVEPPPPAWEPLAVTPGTHPVARLRCADACAIAAAASGAITAAAPAAGEAFFHLPDAKRISPIERAAPLREALALLMAPRGRWLTHAGAVGRDGRGVLLVGRGGAGKSTLALACALAGMEIVADDYVLLEPGPPAAHAMQSTAKLTEDSAARLGLGAAEVDPAGLEPTLEGPPKALVDLRALAPGRLRPRLRIAALVAPVLPAARSPFVGERSTKDERAAAPALEPLAAARALRAVAPSTVFQSAAGEAGALAALAGLVRSVPGYSLRLGPDAAANAALVDDLVGGLG